MVLASLRMALLGATAALAGLSTARAEVPGGVVRIAVLNDASGVFRDTNGPGSIVAARLAAADFAVSTAGRAANLKVEVTSGDHQNKPDVGSALARRWITADHVDAIVDVPNSAVGLAVNEVVRGSHATFLASSTASTELTGRQCSPNTVQWVTDTWAIAQAAAPVVARGDRNWFFLTVDYALGTSIQAEATGVIESRGGKVLGAARHPLGATDFSSYLLEASASKADVLGLANASPDAGNALKQAAEFGLTRTMKVVAFLTFIQDVEALGLQATQGLQLTEPFYWDMNEGTRAFARRWSAEAGGGRMPSSNHAGVYAATLAYLQAVGRVQSTDAALVVPEMKRAPFDDSLFGRMTIRPDGRAMHDMFLFQVKAPSESRGTWDDYRLIATIPAQDAFRPPQPGLCALAK